MAQHISWSQGHFTSLLISESILQTSTPVWTTPNSIIRLPFLQLHSVPFCNGLKFRPCTHYNGIFPFSSRSLTRTAFLVDSGSTNPSVGSELPCTHSLASLPSLILNTVVWMIFLHQHSGSCYCAYSGECMNLNFHVTLQTHPVFWSWISGLPNLKSIWFAGIQI